MPNMNNSALDLNLLAVFREVIRQRNISRAAAELQLSQPTVSKALSRLRQQLGDPLFVRCRGGVEPTPYALQIAPNIDDALTMLTAGLTRSAFDPETAEARFAVIMTDIAEAVILPQTLRAIREKAPRVRFRTRQLPVDETAAALLAGDIDLAIGFLPDFEAGFYQQTVFRTDYVVIGAADNPLLSKSLTMKSFANARLALADAEGTGHHLVERELRKQGLGVQITAIVPRFLSLPLMVASSDLLAIVPRPLATLLGESTALATAAPPLELPVVDIKMLWHQRVHDDPANKWLRTLFAEVFSQTEWS